MKHHTESDGWGWQERLIGAGIVALILLALFGVLRGHAEPLPGNQGGCVPWRNVACTVAGAGPGFAFGDCVWGLSFSGSTRLTFRAGAAVRVSGCADEHHNIYRAVVRKG
jgi:hypothetical protein